jgi:hypothetical protein
MPPTLLQQGHHPAVAVIQIRISTPFEPTEQHSWEKKLLEVRFNTDAFLLPYGDAEEAIKFSTSIGLCD